MSACSGGLPVPGKRAQGKANGGFLPKMGVSPASLQLWWETSGRWPDAADVSRGEEGGCGMMGSERRFGPELLSVELIGWLQAPALLTALYLSYPQHRLPSSNDCHEIQTNFNPLEAAITQNSHLPVYY